MKRSMRAALVIMLAVLTLFTSCGKKEEPQATVEVTETVSAPVETKEVPAPAEKPAEPAVTAPVVTATTEFEEAIPTEIKNDTEKFQYSYGWYLMDALLSQGLVPNGQYFARGIIDCVEMRPDTLLTIDEIVESINTYLENFQGGGEAGEYADLHAVRALEVPESAEERFAYSYGFYNAFQLMQQMIEIDNVWFPIGLMDRLYEREALYTPDEIITNINGWFEAREREYREWLEKTAQSNLELAEKMLAAKAAEEGNIVLSDKLVIEPISLAADSNGAKALYEDAVTVNYTLRDVHGNVLDQGEGITFPISGVIPGFGEACMNMNAGDHIIAYVHPEIGYGERGAGNIAPNSLLVFEIELLDILAEM